MCAPWQHTLLADCQGESDLVFRGGSFYLYATLDQPVPIPVVPVRDPVSGWVGVDLGIVNLAVTTDDDPKTFDVRWSGGAVTAPRKSNLVMRTALQKVGTKSAKRKLRTRRRKEQRFAADVNHQLSKSIVASAQRTVRGIAIEDLLGYLRAGTAGEEAASAGVFVGVCPVAGLCHLQGGDGGVPVQVIDPRNTSRTCSECGFCDAKNRRGQAGFECQDCGWIAHADHNASRSIAVLGHEKYWAVQSTGL